MKKIVHIITGLNNGGAEMMLYKLLCNIDRSKYSIEVISMTDEGVLGSKIRDLGIKVHTLNMKRGVPTFSSIKKTVNIIKEVDILQTWMYHSDLLGFVAGKIAKIDKIIWGIHHSNLDKDKNKRLVLIIAKINSYLSKYVYKIVSCSKYATSKHVQLGYCESKFVNIPNGFDLSMYHKQENSKQVLCRELCIDENQRIVCHVARWDKLKDYETLTSALALLKNKLPDTHFVLCGTGIDKSNEELLRMVEAKNILENTHLMGRRNDVPLIMSASDILVLSSSGEAFPNVIGEAMACETPCVVTDVGDCKFIVGRYGISVEKENPEKLAEAMEEILILDQENLNTMGRLCRERVIKDFEIKKVVRMYTELYI